MPCFCGKSGIYSRFSAVPKEADWIAIKGGSPPQTRVRNGCHEGFEWVMLS